MHDPMDLILGGSVVQAVVPSDFNNTTVDGVWANMTHVECINMLYSLAILGTAGTGPIFSLSQAQDAAGTGAKALEITEAWYLAAADITAPGAAAWTALSASRTPPVASWDADSVGADILELIFVARVHQQNLDTNNGFTHVRMTALSGNTVGGRFGHMMYIATDRKYSGEATPNLLS